LPFFFPSPSSPYISSLSLHDALPISSLSVNHRPVSRLRHWCSSIYLRISPLHMEFHLPLLHSSWTVSNDLPRLSRGLSHQTIPTACAPFTPNNSGQRLSPTYYLVC